MPSRPLSNYVRLLPTEPAAPYDVIKWLFKQTSSEGPLLGQAAHFVSRAHTVDYAVP
jgi:hypothetical protein